jgi:ubiquinone/menaquinone biosynthesis C-methylase UbiE
MSKYTYEQSVQWLRSQPEYTDLVKLCYLDEDNLLAAKRFTLSEEFNQVIKFLRLTDVKQKQKILDLGCGNGIASYAFASLGHAVYAVDPDFSKDVGLGATARLASIVGHNSITTFQAFAESLPFSDSTFNIVYARQALHHFSDLQLGLNECSRVLKPNGLLFATREHVVDNEEQLKAFLENHPLHQFHSQENAYPLEHYRLALLKAGFSILKCFAPFDTVINHFPISNSQIKSWLFEAAAKKLGRINASFITKFTLMENLYRWRLSYSCKLPGRLYSFLCVKQEIR